MEKERSDNCAKKIAEVLKEFNCGLSMQVLPLPEVAPVEEVKPEIETVEVERVVEGEVIN